MHHGLATKDPIKDSARYSLNNPADDHVMNNDDVLGYEVNNTYESAWEVCGGLAVNAAMDPIYTIPLNILANQKECSSVSARFFICDHKNQGGGLRGLVFNSVVDSKNSSDFSSLTVHDMFFHLLIASIHYGISTAKSIDIQTQSNH